MLVLLAVCTLSFRYLLAHLEDAEPRLQAWISKKTGYHIAFESLEGHWRYFTPSLDLVNFKLYPPSEDDALIEVASLELELDLFETLRQQNLVLSKLVIDGLSLDLTTLEDFAPAINKKKNLKSFSIKKEIERLLQIEFGRFSLRNAHLMLKTPSEQIQTLTIENLLWHQNGNNHKLEGVLVFDDPTSYQTKVDKKFNNFEFRGYFEEQNSLESINGRFYAHAHEMELSPWLKKWIAPSVDLIKATLNAKAWVDINKGTLSQAQIKTEKNQLFWRKKELENALKYEELQQISFKAGDIFFLRKNKDQKESVFIGANLPIQADDKSLPLLTFKALMQDNKWGVNASSISLLALNKLSGLFSLSPHIESQLKDFKPKGQINDLRLEFLAPEDFSAPLSFSNFIDNMAYSASIDGLSLAQSGYFPAVNNVHLLLQGAGKKGQAKLELDKQIVPYTAVFQAPLGLKKSHLALYWQPLNEDGFRLWSNDLSLQLDYLGLKGIFALELIKNKSPWLSFYGEGKLQDVGQTWRYLPTPILAPNLTDYLTASLRDGQVNKAQILWQGALDSFPYQNHQGIFQTKLALEKGRFHFDEKWPSLVDLNGTLLFQNNGLLFDVSSAQLFNANANGYDIKGTISDFGPNALLSLEGKVAATGDSLQQYMMATPLVDSIGAALNQVQIKGDIDGNIALKLPLNGDKASVSGRAFLDKNQVSLAKSKLLFEEVKGQISFDDERLFATDINAILAGQAVNIGFEGEDKESGYHFDLNIKGNWFAKKLLAFFTQSELGLVTGQSAWNFNLALKLKDTGFAYHGKLFANLNALTTNLPAPFSAEAFKNQIGKLTVQGDELSFNADLSLPHLHYLAHVDISKKVAEVTRSYLGIQDDAITKSHSFLMPLAGKALNIDINHLDLLAWKAIWQQSAKAFENKSPIKNSQRNDNQEQTDQKPMDELSALFTPLAKMNLKAQKLKIGELSFNGVDFSAREQEKGYQFAIRSEEIAAKASLHNKQLLVDVDYVFLNLPKEKNLTDEKERSSLSFFTEDKTTMLRANKIEKAIYTQTPSIDLRVKDLWLQGYRLGKLDAKIEKTPKAILLSQFDISSDQTHLSSTGRWTVLPDDIQKSRFQYKVSGDNISELMGRFTHAGGIHDAAFETQGSVSYKGAPWAPDEESLNGKLSFDLTKGYISGVGGVGRLLGLFSFNSILRKLKLDFSGVFEDGLAFDYISGGANIKNGIVTANNIKMKALAGEMYINGTADLINNQVNANVKFIPDLTSGLPVLTAFAVAPQAALYVLALTTVISPVIDAITQVNYTVTGTIDSPKIQEKSRTNALVTLSKEIADKFRRSKDKK